MDYFDQAWTQTHGVEKGYVNNPHDPGGETNHGITVRVARAHGYLGPMRDLPLGLATSIARTEYWERLRLDEIAAMSPRIAMEVFDTNFNFYEGAAAEFLQRSINAMTRSGLEDLKVDGVIGSGTVSMLGTVLRSRARQEAEEVLLKSLNALQCCDYIRQANAQPQKRDFFAGWVLQRVRV